MASHGLLVRDGDNHSEETFLTFSLTLTLTAGQPGTRNCLHGALAVTRAEVLLTCRL